MQFAACPRVEIVRCAQLLDGIRATPVLRGVSIFAKEDLAMRNSRTMICKELISLASYVLALVLAGSASAAIVEWDGGGAGLLWSEPQNWAGDSLPGSDDQALINIPDANCLIDPSVTAMCGTLHVGQNMGPCYLNMTGGTLTTAGHLRIGYSADSNGVFTMSGGTVSTGTGRLWVGYNAGSNGTLIMTGGQMTVATKLELGKNAGSNGWIYLHGGALNVTGGESDDLEIARYGTGTIYMTGGALNVTDKIKIGESGGTGHIYLYGGTINSGNDDLPMSETSIIDITAGTLVLPGDATSAINEHIGNGRITAYGGEGRVQAIYDDVQDQTTVTAIMAEPEVAWTPSPPNWAIVPWTPAGPTLSWRPGEDAASHDVYFGTNSEDVNDANNTPGLWPEYKGNQDPCSYDPGPLDLGTTYYWRVDEVNGPNIWKGAVWSFTASNYIVVDDMESYGDAETPGPPPPPGSRMWYTWKDGEGWTQPSVVPGNGSGSVVDPNSGIVHGGTQSLEFIYDNDGTNVFGSSTEYYSEIRADAAHLPVGRNWTEGGVKALSLWFYGDAGNDANATEQMYVKLNGVKRDYDGDMSDIRQEQWHEWNIELASFGVDLANITSVAIGFGDEANMTPGGSGFVYFDDIRLYRPRCIPSLRKPAADVDSDCDVDYDDLDLMAGDWLESDENAVGSDGVLENFPTDNSQWVNDPQRGRCLQFDGVNDWVYLDDDDFSNFHDKTISLWANIAEYADPYPYVFCFQNAGDDPYRIYIRTRGENTVRVRFVEDYLSDFMMGTGVWRHVAFVIRDTDDGKCTGEFYGDGELIDELPGQPRHSGGAKGVNLGSFNDGGSGFLNAAYDEFRVYDYALSADEIKQLAGLAGGVEPTGDMLLHYKFDEVSGLTAKNSSTYVFNRPLLSGAELYEAEPQGSRAVNFRDFAVLAEMWLAEQLWP